MERRLGRGLGSLLGEVDVEDEKKSSNQLPIRSIRPNPFQPRQVFDAVALRELAESIKSHGVLQPVVVRASSVGFELIAGERRWRAAGMAGLTAIPALVRHGVSDQEMLELALVENVQRQDLNAIERARGFRAMIDALGITQDAVAGKVGLERSTVANHLRLLELPEQIQEGVSRGMISMGHARALLGLTSPVSQTKLFERIAREGLSVRQVEALARSSPAAPPAMGSVGRKILVPQQGWVRELEARLRERLATKVTVANRAGFRGEIVISYYDRAGLERLADALAPIAPIV